jgi:hypothetical protein
LLARHVVPLIEDDVYGELYFGKQRPGLTKSHDGAGLVMHCSSFSRRWRRAFAWAGPWQAAMRARSSA